jgi:hypothetical protein
MRLRCKHLKISFHGLKHATLPTGRKSYLLQQIAMDTALQTRPWFFTLAIFLCSATASLSQDIAGAFNKNIDYFTKISSISFTGKSVHVVVADPNVHQVTTTQYLGSNDRFAFKVDQNLGKQFGGETIESACYNGDIYQYRTGPILQTQKGVKEDLHFLCGNIPFIKPFEFIRMALASDHSSSDWELTPDRLKDPKIWALFKSKIKSVSEGKLQGKEGILVTLTGQENGTDLNLTVLFDPSENFYPTVWQRTFVKTPDISEIYMVTKFGRVTIGSAPILYPEVATLTRYLRETEVRTVTTITVCNLSLDKVDLDDPRFTLDPSQFDFIADQTKGVLISVPK